MAGIYLSFAPEDETEALALLQFLRSRGILMTFLSRSPPNAPFATHDAAAIESSVALAVLISEHSLQSGVVAADVELARARLLPIFGLLIGGMKRETVAGTKSWASFLTVAHLYSMAGDSEPHAVQLLEVLGRLAAEPPIAPKRTGDLAALSDRAAPSLPGDAAALGESTRTFATPPRHSTGMPASPMAKRRRPPGDFGTWATDLGTSRPAMETRSSSKRTGSGGPPPASGRSGPAKRLSPRSRWVDELQFGVTSPAVVVPGSACVVDVWAFAEAMRHTLLERAAKESGGPVRLRSQGPHLLARGISLAVRLRLPGMKTRPAQSRLWWNGSLANAGFMVDVPDAHAPGPAPGEATIHVAGLRLTTVSFTLTVGLSEGATALHDSQERRSRTAFASYASHDRRAVAARVHALQKAGVDVYMDVLRLQSGQKFENQLLRRIEQSDVFYLFWSRAAKKSQWVDREWRHALEKRGIDCIDPFPLEPPTRVSPPAELAELHFDDWVLAYERAHPDRKWWQLWRR